MDDRHEQPGGTATQAQQSEEDRSEIDQRAAYEAELNRITTQEMILQTAVSLLNLGGRRLGLDNGPGDGRDLEQVRDAIDAVRGLMPVLERRMPKELGPLRDALAQLQMAFARDANAKSEPKPAEPTAPDTTKPGPKPAEPTAADTTKPGPKPAEPTKADTTKPGPAESSGRLWVPGR